MKHKLTQNLDLKVLAVLFSIIIWVIVVNIDDPVKNVTFNDIPIRIINENELTDQNLDYEVVDSLEYVDVMVSGRRSIIEDLSKENISAVADFKNINDSKYVPLKFSSNKYASEITDIKASTDTIELNVEKHMKIQKAIQISTVGTPAAGYIKGDSSINLNQVRIEGPESVINEIAVASAQVDIEGASNNVSASLPIVLYDKEANPIDTSRISMNINTVSINQEILFTKKVPITYGITGEPEEGYRFTGKVELSETEVLLAGSKNVLEGVSQVVIPGNSLNVDGLTSNLKTNINITSCLPKGCEFVDSRFDGVISATVYIEKESSMEMSLQLSKIVIKGCPSDKNAEISDNVEAVSNGKIVFNVNGLQNDLNNLTAADVIVSVDLNDYIAQRKLNSLPNGVITVPVTFVLPNGLHVDEEVKIQIRISNIS